MSDIQKRVVLYVILVVVIIAAAVWGYHLLHPPQPTTFQSQQQASTPQGAQEAASIAGFTITPGQAREVAQAVQEATTRPPDNTITTTGAGMPQALTNSLHQTGANFQIVTDPAKPDKPPDKPAADQPVNLNVYNVKAYPKHLVEVTAYQRAADVAYMTRVTVFKHTGYLGPVVNYDTDRKSGKVKIGLRLSVPLD